MRNLLVFIFILTLSHFGNAKSLGKNVEYKIGDQAFEAYVATPKLTKKGPYPAVLVVHNWMGITDETKKQADKIAELGYVAFAVDVYGKGVRPADMEGAKKESGKYYADQKLWRERLNAGLEEVKKIKGVNPSKLAAIGYCFGGSAVIELARTGADLKAVVSFHGGLNSTSADAGKNIKAKVLALNGADDPYNPQDNINRFQTEMKTAKVDWQLINYGNAVHSFTEVGAGNDNSKGAAYNADADRRSWAEMKRLLSEVL